MAGLNELDTMLGTLLGLLPEENDSEADSDTPCYIVEFESEANQEELDLTSWNGYLSHQLIDTTDNCFFYQATFRANNDQELNEFLGSVASIRLKSVYSALSWGTI